MKQLLRGVSLIGMASLLMIAVMSGCSKKKSPEEGVPGAEGEGAEGTPGFDESVSGDLSQQASENLKTVFFAYDNYSLSAAARQTLQDNANWLKSNGTVVIQIEGHCDERGSIEYNLALGEKRANAVVTYLKKLGIDSSRMSVISYGEERPIDPGSNEAAWAKNRRSEFVVLSQ